MNKIFLSVLLLLPALFPVQGQSWPGFATTSPKARGAGFCQTNHPIGQYRRFCSSQRDRYLYDQQGYSGAEPVGSFG